MSLICRWRQISVCWMWKRYNFNIKWGNSNAGTEPFISWTFDWI